MQQLFGRRQLFKKEADGGFAVRSVRREMYFAHQSASLFQVIEEETNSDHNRA
jgi:hypothetical protein